jgi:hypothetical protein
MLITTHADLVRTAARQHGLITRRQLDRDAWTDRKVRYRVLRGTWQEVQNGVFAIAGSPPTWEQALLAAVLCQGDLATGSHRGSARLHGIPGFGSAKAETLVLDDGRGSEPPVGAIRHFTNLLPKRHRKVLRGIPTTTVARTLFDLGAVVHPGKAARAVDNCISRNWVTIPALWRVLDDLAIQGRNGTCALRDILMERGLDYVAPASDLERRFIEIIRRAGVPFPAREVDLGDPDQWIGRVEFVWREVSLLVEIDSDLHHSAYLDVLHDQHRDDLFEGAGFTVLRIGEALLDEDPALIERTLRELLRAAA